jgi:hypothetical protein
MHSGTPEFNFTEVTSCIYNIYRKLLGLGSNYVLFNLSLFVCQCFYAMGIAVFDLDMLTLQIELDNNHWSHSWESVLARAIARYNVLKNSN